MSTHLATRATLYEDLRWRAADLLERMAGRLGGRFAELALSGPDLVYLFARVVTDERVSRARRGELVASVIYVVSPFDLVPESLFGPVGLIDDAVVLSRLLDTLLNRVDDQVVAEHWPGDAQQLARMRRLAGETRRMFSLGLGTGVRRLGRQLALNTLTGLRTLASAQLARVPGLAWLGRGVSA